MSHKSFQKGMLTLAMTLQDPGNLLTGDANGYVGSQMHLDAFNVSLALFTCSLCTPLVVIITFEIQCTCLQRFVTSTLNAAHLRICLCASCLTCTCLCRRALALVLAALLPWVSPQWQPSAAEP